mgnify:FL=1
MCKILGAEKVKFRAAESQQELMNMCPKVQSRILVMCIDYVELPSWLFANSIQHLRSLFTDIIVVFVLVKFCLGKKGSLLLFL